MESLIADSWVIYPLPGLLVEEFIEEGCQFFVVDDVFDDCVVEFAFLRDVVIGFNGLFDLLTAEISHFLGTQVENKGLAEIFSDIFCISVVFLILFTFSVDILEDIHFLIIIIVLIVIIFIITIVGAVSISTVFTFFILHFFWIIEMFYVEIVSIFDFIYFVLVGDFNDLGDFCAMHFAEVVLDFEGGE